MNRLDQIQQAISIVNDIDSSSLPPEAKLQLFKSVIDEVTRFTNKPLPLVEDTPAPHTEQCKVPTPGEKPHLPALVSDRIKALGFELNHSTLNKASAAIRDAYLVTHGCLPPRERNGRYVHTDKRSSKGTYVYSQDDIPLMDDAICQVLGDV